MSHHHPRRILTPPASRKRKEMEALLNPRKPPPFAKPKAAPQPTPFKAQADPAAPSSLLLAGYMAHEFLTRGTLLGQKWDPARAEAAPVSNGKGRPKPAEEAEPSRKGKPKQLGEKKHDDDERYAEVARLLKEEGAHVAGIVNPTQLARWIRM